MAIRMHNLEQKGDPRVNIKKVAAVLLAIAAVDAVMDRVAAAVGALPVAQPIAWVAVAATLTIGAILGERIAEWFWR